MYDKLVSFMYVQQAFTNCVIINLINCVNKTGGKKEEVLASISHTQTIML